MQVGGVRLEQAIHLLAFGDLVLSQLVMQRDLQFGVLFEVDDRTRD